MKRSKARNHVEVAVRELEVRSSVAGRLHSP